MQTRKVNWKQRERRLRARYRRKVWAAGILAAIAGLIIGFVLHAVFFNENTDALSVPPVVQPSPEVVYITPEPMPEVTPQVIYITPEPAPAMTPQTVYVTAEPVAPQVIYITPEPTAMPEQIAFLQPDAATQAPIETAAPDAATVPNSILPADPTAAPETVSDPTVDAATEIVSEDQPIIVPFGQSMTFSSQVKKDGKARRDIADSDYETVNLTLKVNAYKRPGYFEERYYDSFRLKGNETAVEFDITLNGYTGTTQIIPQNFLRITLRGETDDVTAPGYQLMDKEMNGKTGIALLTDRVTTLYKRYPYSVQQGHMKYMVVTTYMDGVPQSYWFEIINPVAVEYAELSKGMKDHTEEVKRLQGKLQRMGLLSAEEKLDGKFGGNTQTAVMAAQKRLGLPETGVADSEFLRKLYDE